MSSALIELQLLPSLEYFCALQPVDHIVLEKHEHFTKQSYRNRCYILAAHGPVRLTVPLRHVPGKSRITEVQIDDSSRWQTNFWRTLESAYAKAPFYEHYAGSLREEIFRDHQFLYAMNKALLSLCLQWLRWSKSISESVDYEKISSAPITDLRGQISAKRNFSLREFYLPQPYQQVFGSNFVPNLSLIDLVFCEGPGASAILNASRPKN